MGYLTKKSTEEYIDPATENLQEELLTELRKHESSTNDIKVQNLTLAANVVGIPDSHGCKSVRIITGTALVYMDTVDGDVETTLVEIQEDETLTIPINNVGNLRFLCATGGTIVRLISCN